MSPHLGASFVLAVSLLLATGNGAWANPGDLDPSFGTGGVVTTTFGTEEARALAVALQADGKIVAVGTNTTGTFELARYNVDGSLDTTFGIGGSVTTAIGGINDFAEAVAVQEDGKIIVAGTTDTGTQNVLGNDQTVFALVRYNPDGGRDETFGSGGTVTTAFGTVGDRARTIVLQDDGKVVLGGNTFTACDPSSRCEGAFALARYDTVGSLDSTFGTGGKVITPFGTSSSIHAVALQGDGKLVVAGSTIDDGGAVAGALARYNADGTLDATFGTGGIATGAALNFAGAEAVALQPDGKIVAAGPTEMQYLHARDFMVARYNSDGKPDSTFGTAGTATAAFGNVANCAGVALQGDGKIVAAGDTQYQAFALARFNAEGTLDASFGTRGTVTTGLSDFAEGTAVVLQRDGKIVLAGYADTDPVDFVTGFALARYLDGSTGTTITTTSTTTTTSTANPIPSTTTTVPCATARCTLSAALASPACAGQIVPASVTGKLATAETLIDQAATTPGKKGRTARHKAKSLLRQAGANAIHAAKGKRAKLSRACATALKSAAGLAAAGL
jgi:uncharacterized delta-60 repeat protein